MGDVVSLMEILLITSLVIICFFICVIAILLKEINRLKADIPKQRKDALDKSRAVIKGQISEQVAPFMKGFPYQATDLKFFGNGFDYFVISNMSNARDNDEDIKELVFVDIKTNSAQLSKTQRKIRDCIIRGDVYWETITIKDDNCLTINRASNKTKEPKGD